MLTAKPSALGLCAEEHELWSDFGSRELKTLESSSEITWNPGLATKDSRQEG